MGRAYGLPGEPGVLNGSGCRVFSALGVKIPYVTRVEFDADADEGMATVTAYVRDADGSLLTNPIENEVCRATFRTWVRLVHRDQPDPPRTPNVIFWQNADGTVTPGVDPLPDVPFQTTHGGNHGV